MEKINETKVKVGWNQIFPELERWVKNSGIFFSFYNKRSVLMAKRKAISELFEHLFFREVSSGAHPSGVGIGYSPKTAKEKALQELLERDRFFNHYTTMLPFLNSKRLDKLLRKKSFKTFEDQLREIGIKVIVKEMLPSKNHRFVIVNLFGQSYGKRGFGVITGLGSGLNLKDALEHACCEARLILFGVLADENYLIPEGSQFWIEDPYVSHVLFGRKIESGKIWSEVFMSSNNVLKCDQSSWSPKIVVKVKQFSTFAKKKVPKIFFATTNSTMIQKAFWGKINYMRNKPIPSVINWSAREKFISEYKKMVESDKPISPKLPHFPHVCG